MAEKDLHYRLTADIKAFDEQFKRAQRSARALERELAKQEKRQEAVHRSMEEVGRGMVVAGAVIAAGLGLAVKAAIEWESAWAGVVKTVEGSPEQMAALEEELRDLAGALPATHTEIAKVAEAAGQLGIKRQDIASFTKTMIDMGVATNLTAEEAAVAIARMSNIMGTAPKDVRRLASAIVDLGNNSATTEADIVAMSLRIAGAGNIIGLSESDVLGFAAALSSVGIQAEAGGSAISLAFTKIDAAVKGGGDKLAAFAEVAGLSAEQFKRAYEEDAASAINTFIIGLGRINQSGGDVFGTLESLGLTGIRLRDSLLRLSGAGDLLTRSLDTGSEAWEKNNALTKEAERRYQTTEARMRIARNQVQDFGITMGQTLLPAVGAVVDFVSAFADVLGDMPGPIQTAIAIVAALTAGILLLGGAAMIAVPRMAAMRQAMDQIAAAGGRAAAGVGLMRTVGSGLSNFLLGPWGLALGAAVVAMTAFAASQAAAKAEAKELADTLDEQSGAVTRNTRLWVANELAEGDAFENAEKLGISKKDLVGAILGEEDALKRVNKALHEHRVIGRRAADSLTDEQRAAESTSEEMARLRKRLKEAKELQDAVADSTKGTKDEMDALDPSTRGMADALGLSADEAQNLADEIDNLEKELKALHDEIFGLEEAEDALAESFKRAREAAKSNEAGIKGNSKAALENRSRLRDLVKAHEEHLVAMRRNGASAGELQAAHEKFRRKLIDVLMAMGLSRKEAEKYADRLADIPRTVETNVKADVSGAEGKVNRMLRKLRELERTRHIRVAGVTGRGGFTAFEHGGSVRNTSGVVPGHGPTDSILARVTPGEFVVRAAPAARNRGLLEAINAGAHATAMGSTVNNYQITVRTISGEFSWSQVKRELAFQGVS